MSLASYASAALGFSEELADSLSEREIQTLRAHFSEKMPRLNWDVWKLQNKVEIAAFVAASPSERKKRKAWNHPPEKKLLLTLAAYQHCREGYLLLSFADRLVDLAGLTNRIVASQAGLQCRQLLGKLYQDEELEWPYDDSPFLEDDEDG
ncbi:MAG: hypothetical protein HQL07_04630 [Nitrospirae bacterium]|nr:hypothetical protein [Magnetococcales bacterium]HAT50775.1 hypothetical protein [Alphaproteobacteria bacterium]